MRGDAYERLQERSRREFGDRRDFDVANQPDDRRELLRRNERYRQADDFDRNENERGWLERASNEVSSWFGGSDQDSEGQQTTRSRYGENEYDRSNRLNNRQADYAPKGVTPNYPATSPIYEREDSLDDFSSRDVRRNRSRSFNEANSTRVYNEPNQSNQNRNFSQPRGFVSTNNQNFQRQPQQQQQQQNRWRDWHDTRAGDLMSRRVATVQPNETVQRAARLMRDEDCGALPVVDREGRMIGMITDRDITVRLVADGADPSYAQVNDCMTDEVFACHVNDPVEGCIRTMKEHQVRRIAIVNDRNQVLGIISQGDLARYADMNKRQGQRHAVTEMIAGVSEPSNDAYR